MILHLHSGLSPTKDASAVPLLGIGAAATIVDVKYETSKEQPYPSPIHSVLAAYDWTQENICRGSNQLVRPDGYQRRPIGVCGQLVGGGLATMLALTECHRSTGITAVLVGDPVVDWVALGLSERMEERPKKSQKTKKTDQVTSPIPNQTEEELRQRLLNLRNHVFKSLEKCFDPFASPLLFFRTPKYELKDTRSWFPEDGDVDCHMMQDAQDSTFVKKRLSYRAYPPLWSNLVLPQFRLETADDSPLRGPATELVQMMERSVGKRKDTDSVESADRFEVVTRPKWRPWNKQDMFRIGQWLGDALSRS